MSYHMPQRRRPLSGLGYDIIIGLPQLLGGPQKISLPLEKLAHDGGQMAIDAAWPPLKDKLEAEMPVLIDMLKAQVPGLLDQALKQAQTQVVTKLWPALQPKVRAELDYGISEGKKVAYMVGGGIVLSMILIAAAGRRREKKLAAAK